MVKKKVKKTCSKNTGYERAASKSGTGYSFCDCFTQ